MRNPIWKAIVGGLKGIIEDIEKAIAEGAHELWTIITAVFKAEETQLMADIKPMLQTIAINLQNERPGLDAQTFIPALVAAAIPVLTAEGKVLKHTAISVIASTVSHELGIPDVQGNAGIVSTGDTNSESAPA